MSQLPKDPMILLSYVNMQLRDFYSSLDEFCSAQGTEKEAIEEALKAVGYSYDSAENRFR